MYVSWLSCSSYRICIIFNPYWTRKTLWPSLVRDGKDIYVPLLYRYLKCHELGGAQIIITLWSGGMSSWTMVNNEENWLLLQIKDWFNLKNKKSPKGAQSLGLVKFKVPSPQRVKGVLNSNICHIFILLTLWIWYH